MVISDNIELEISYPVAPMNKVDADIIGNNETMKTFEELAKIPQIIEVSYLYLLLVKTNHTKFINHISISNMVYKVFISVYKTTASMDNLVNDNY